MSATTGTAKPASAGGAIPMDLRAAVASHFMNFDDAPVKAHVAKFEKIAGLRLVSLVLLLVQLIAIHLPVLAISGSDANTNNDIFRALSMVCTFFLNLYAIVILNQAVTAFRVLQTFFVINFLCLVFEMAMFHLGTHHEVVIFFGIASVIIRSVQIFLSAKMVFKAVRAGACSEETYTRYMDHLYTSMMNQGVKNVVTQAEAFNPKTQQEAKLLALLLAPNTRAAATLTDAAAAKDVVSVGSGDESDETTALKSVEMSHMQTIAEFGAGSSSTNWKLWNCATHIRKLLFTRDRFGHLVTVILLSILLALTIGNFVFEFVKIFMNQTPLLDTDLNDKYNDIALTKEYMPTRTHSSWKVHIVVVDGLRYDHTEPGQSAIGDMINTAAFQPHSVRFAARAQLPSFSVPNWMSILTGAPPENHGVTGNIGNDETSFDHIFRQAKKYGIHAGMTGTPWWKLLVFSTLPPLDGDGTIDSQFRPAGWPKYPKSTADPGDWARLEVALRAARRSTVTLPFEPVDNTTGMYGLFLTHFSDVDMQGHEYGIDTEWNPDDSYMRAIANKSEAIRQIIDVIDDRTVLIITSDHGHVKRGGHGGVSMELRDVPVIFYVKNSNLASRVPAATFLRPDVPPRSEAGGAYQNLDICATVSALLGIPSPRQSIGVFIEEIVEALVPDAYKLIHYYDLFRAKVSSFREYREMMRLGIFSAIGGALDADKINETIATWDPVALNTSASKATLMETIIEMRDAYNDMSTARRRYLYIRNLVCSCLLIVPWLLLMLFIFDTATVVNMPSLVDSSSPCSALNRIACFKGFITVFFYLLISIVVFLIAYFPITGYTVWDSTLTHTPSVALRYLVTTIIAPIIIFVVLTKLFLANCIEWKLPQIFAVRRFGIGKLDAYRVGAFLNFAFQDIKTFCFTTKVYKPEKFPEAYVYIYFLAFWTSFATSVVLIIAFPFTWVIPIVFSTEHVTEFNLQHRFRVITVMMILVPLQVGTLMLLIFRPALSMSSMLQWDNLFIQAHLEHDLYELKKLIAAAEKDKKSEKASSATTRPQEAREPEALAATSPGDGQLQVESDPDTSLDDSGKRQTVPVIKAAPAPSASAPPAGPPSAIQYLQQRAALLEDCMSALQDPQFRVMPSELFLAQFYDEEGVAAFRRRNNHM